MTSDFIRNPYLRATTILVVLTGTLLAAWLVWLPGRDVLLASYLPLHSLLETCSIIVCVLVFIVSRTTFGDQRNRNMMLIGASFLGVAVLDFLHAQSYLGMPALVTPSSQEKAIGFWLAARLLAAVGLLSVAYLSWQRMEPAGHCGRWTAGVLGLVSLVTWVILFRPQWLPRTFIADQGLTAFKIQVELLVIALSLAAAFGFYRQACQPRPITEIRTDYDPFALMAATIVTALAEVFFAIYTDANGLLNVIGHGYKVIGAWLIYLGLVARNLPEAQTRNALAIEAAELGIWTWNVRSDQIEWDESAARSWVWSASFHPTMSHLDAMVHPEDRTHKQEAMARALDPHGDGTYRAEYRIVVPGEPGERRVASFGRTEFRDGVPVRVIGIVRDVTERRRAEAAVLRSEARLSGILSIAADAIIAIDEQQHIIIFNHGAETTFGYSSDEVMGKSLDMLLPERFRGQHSRHVDEFARSGTTARRMGERRDIFGLHKNGKEFPAEASISMLVSGSERTFTVVLRDITARKVVEQQLELNNQLLEARVAERTAELQAETERRLEAQAALARAQRMEAFGQLAGGIAHDFNNLLTVISGNQELLEMQLEDAKQRTLLKRSQEAAEMGARLTARLLTFARRRQLEPTILDLNEQITGMVELLRRSIGEDITLTTNLAPRLWKVRADASEIENAVLNLAINARDAMAHGGTLVIETADCTVNNGEIGGEHKLQAGDYVRISVADSGAGMPPEVLARAFEPFFTTKPPGKGTGLGLSTIYGFVQQSGGTVTIYSVPERGTTVSIYLPRAVERRHPGGVARASDQIPVGAGETILVVEDNPEVREVGVKRIQGLGYKVIEAESAPEAIAIIQTPDSHIDLVFSDVVMPGGMSGVELAQWIGANAQGIKVLLTSGYSEKLGSPDRAPLPAVRVLAKPYGRLELARALQDVLKG